MDINRLLADELVYELYVRDRAIGRTVAENRALLREALRLEKIQGPSSFAYILDAAEEIRTCEAKLVELEQAIVQFNTSNRVNEFKRILTRLLHVAERLNRVTCKEVDPEIDRLRLIAKCTRLISKVTLLNNEEEMFEHERNMSGNIMDSPVPTSDRNILMRRGEVPVSQDLIELGPVENMAHQDNFSPQQAKCSTHCQPLIERAGIESRTQSLFFEPMGRVESRYPVQPTIIKQDSKMDPSRILPETRAQPQYDLVSRNSQLATCDSEELENNLAELQLRYDSHSQQIPPRNWAHTTERFEYPSLKDCSRGLNQNARDPYHHTNWYHPTHIDVSRWNLRFNGRTSVNDFLERVEEIRISRNIHKADLLRFAPELLTHEALLWYRTGRFENWDDLCHQLKEAFRPFDYEFSLWDEIRHRTQGSQEKVLTFITAMENLFRKLEQNVPEESRVKFMRRNLLPHIQTQIALQEVKSVTELTKLARAVEETEWRTKRFIPPPTNYCNLLEPELAYRKPTSTRVAAVTIPEISTSEANKSETGTEQKSRAAAAECWNCGSTQHKFRNCRAEKKRFCYRCGQPNVFSDNCPKCAKNGKRGRQQ